VGTPMYGGFEGHCPVIEKKAGKGPVKEGNPGVIRRIPLWNYRRVLPQLRVVLKLRGSCGCKRHGGLSYFVTRKRIRGLSPREENWEVKSRGGYSPRKNDQ